MFRDQLLGHSPTGLYFVEIDPDSDSVVPYFAQTTPSGCLQRPIMPKSNMHGLRNIVEPLRSTF